MRRERFPRHRLERKPLVSDADMHHGTCVTHVSWCMSGSLPRGGGENIPVIPGACATRKFYVSGKRPMGNRPDGIRYIDGVPKRSLWWRRSLSYRGHTVFVPRIWVIVVDIQLSLKQQNRFRYAMSIIRCKDAILGQWLWKRHWIIERHFEAVCICQLFKECAAMYWHMGTKTYICHATIIDI